MAFPSEELELEVENPNFSNQELEMDGLRRPRGASMPIHGYH
jgi:hypothetical protein